MRDHQFQLGSRWIGGDHPCYVIAEIGQNHQGDIELAKQMILAAKESGADCVKFQKSCLAAKFTQATLDQPYDSPNAWGPTYGQHKAYLEFSVAQFAELQAYAEQQVGVAFTASAMDAVSMRQLLGGGGGDVSTGLPLAVPFVKIGSGDANNIQLLEEAAASSRRRRPLIVSTGMQTERMIRRIVHIMGEADLRDFALLHCVSAYPVRPADARLRMVDVLRQWFPGVCVGYSGHERGIALTLASVVMGAKVIERHFTLDPTMKGTDHQLSLTPATFRRLVANIRTLEAVPGPDVARQPNIADAEPFGRVCDALQAAAIPLDADELADIRAALAPLGPSASTADAVVADCERPCWLKLGKSLVFAGDRRTGHVLTGADVCFKVSVTKGLLDGQYDAIVGRRLVCDVAYEEPVLWSHFEGAE